jgi:hypothetical protein
MALWRYGATELLVIWRALPTGTLFCFGADCLIIIDLQLERGRASSDTTMANYQRPNHIDSEFILFWMRISTRRHTIQLSYSYTKLELHNEVGRILWKTALPTESTESRHEREAPLSTAGSGQSYMRLPVEYEN